MTGSEFIKLLNDNSDGITAFSAIGALVISSFAIIRASQDNRKQLIVSKIEEIYELTIFLYVEYSKLHYLATTLEDIYTSTVTDQKYELDNFHLILQDAKKSIDFNDLYNKTLRINVLANTYLQKKIRLEIIAYVRLFQCVIATIHTAKLDRKNKEFKEGFPTTDNLLIFVESTTPKLVSLINLGEKRRNRKNEYLSYFENDFKTKLKLK